MGAQSFNHLGSPLTRLIFNKRLLTGQDVQLPEVPGCSVEDATPSPAVLSRGAHLLPAHVHRLTWPPTRPLHGDQGICISIHYSISRSFLKENTEILDDALVPPHGKTMNYCFKNAMYNFEHNGNQPQWEKSTTKEHRTEDKT